jgi:hypothetical protein
MKRLRVAVVLGLAVVLLSAGTVHSQIATQDALPSDTHQCYCNGRYTVVSGITSCQAWCAGSSTPAAAATSPVNSAVVNAASQAGYQVGSAIGAALVQFLFGAPSNPQAELQKQQMMAELQRRQAEAQRQHQEEEAARLAAMYNRLASTLKLSGLPSLQLKQSASAGPGLALKLGDNANEPAGIKGLPGIALNDGKVPYGIPGLPGIYVGGPGQGSGLTDSKLALKIGESQTEAEQGANASSASSASEEPPGAPATATTGPAPALANESGLQLKTGDSSATPSAQVGTLDPSKMTPQQLADVAETVSKLPPEEQDRLLAAAQNGTVAAQPATGMTGPPPSPVLSSLQQQAGASRAAAAAPVAEDASMQARAGFDTAMAPADATGSGRQSLGATAANGPAPSIAGKSSGTLGSMNSPPLPARVERSPDKIDVPVPRPEGWVASADKGNRTLAFAATRTEAARKQGCKSAEQTEKLEELRVLGQQLARTEKLINDINRQAPDRFAEFKQLDEQLRKDKQDFIDQAISGLAGPMFAMHNQLQRGTLQSTAQGVEILKRWQGTVSEWKDRLDDLEKLRSSNRSENIQGLWELSSDIADKMKDIEGLPGAEYLKNVFESVGMAKRVKDVTDVALGFEKLEIISDYRVTTAVDQAEADLKARAVLLPLQRRLSDKIDTLQRSPVLAGAACP